METIRRWSAIIAAAGGFLNRRIIVYVPVRIRMDRIQLLRRYFGGIPCGGLLRPLRSLLSALCHSGRRDNRSARFVRAMYRKSHRRRR
jgi:hypothetical protein